MPQSPNRPYPIPIMMGVHTKRLSALNAYWDSSSSQTSSGKGYWVVIILNTIYMQAFCCYHNVSVVKHYSLHQVYVDPGLLA